MHALTLTYTLKLVEGGSITPVWQPLQRLVYDGPFEGHLWALYDSNKKQLCFGDVYGKAAKVPKGEYTITMRLRHDSVQELEQHMDLPMRIDKTLASDISVPIFPSLDKALTDVNGSKAKEFRTLSLRAGERAALFIGPVPEDKLPKDAVAGTHLWGEVSLAKCTGAMAEKPAPTKCHLIYTVPGPKKRQEGSGDGGKEEENGDDGQEELSAAEKVKESRRDADLKILKGCKTTTEEEKAAYTALSSELKAVWPKYLPVFVEGLERAAEVLTGEDVSEVAIEAVLAAADEVLSLIDQDEVARFVAFKDPAETPKEKAYKKEMKLQKSALISAIHNICKAYLAKVEKETAVDTSGDQTEGASKGEPAQEALAQSDTHQRLESNYKELCKWVDTAKEVEYVGLFAGRESRAGRYASAIKALDGALNDKDASKPASKALHKQKLDLLRKLGWNHWASVQASFISQAFPADYALL